MSNRNSDMGMDVGIQRRINAKYDPSLESEICQWMSTILELQVPTGKNELQAFLKDGQILIQLMNKILSSSKTLPPRAAKLKANMPLKVNKMSASFKQMENVQVFLNAAEAYGVPKESLFQTVDLYENRNMTCVLNTLYGLGTECQRNEFNGPVCGPKPTTQNKREFTQEQLNASKNIIGLQAGSNKGASQSGMSMGGARHISDIKVEEMDRAGQSIIGLQAGSNKGASQSGMSMGAARHIADIKVEEMDRDGMGTIGLQAGSNKGASQKGMSMGATRHVADIKVDDMDKSGQNVIGLQAGSNKGASQAGMSMGSVRHIADIKVDPMSKEGAAQISLQMGSAQNEVASQSGMSYGAQRRIVDSH